MSRYTPTQFEQRWQEEWAQKGLYTSNLESANPFYCLAEFAYPSGDLHMGHWFTWGGADIYARFKRMQGYNVFFPNGFDAFGLPAENAAIKRNIHPQDWTLENIEKMKKQFTSMGASFSFDHQVITCLPDYYKWNQWIFLKMLEKGIAYRGTSSANWCPSCQTVLANEGVENGKCWRCGSDVIQKEIPQWFFKITEYAERLLWKEEENGLSNGVDWPKAVRESQNDWVGKSEGMLIKFPLDSKEKNGEIESLEVYTSYPETIFGVTYMVVAPEHKLIENLLNSRLDSDLEILQKVREYVENAKKKLQVERKVAVKDKTGVFTGVYCTNPVDGKLIPIWVADYVIGSYGTGAVMGVPGSDLRDFEFAQKFDLEVVRVVGKDINDLSPVVKEEDILEEGIIVNSEQFSGLETPKIAREKIKDYLEELGVGKRSVQYHIHDWSISRQRYWGTPIPVIHCSACGIVPVEEKNLPVQLPYDVDYTPKGKSPLASNEEWLLVVCPKCGGKAERDADTMDTFVDSSWYFLRYLSVDIETKPFDIEVARKVMPVDIYFGGAEHTLGHTLYSRFFTKFFYDLEMIEVDEYAKKRINHGIVLGPDGNKMSKSKGNVVNPDEEVKKYGADAVRVYMAFFMPYDGTGPWISDKVWGSYRFLERVWNLQDKLPKQAHFDAPGNDLSKTDLLHMHATIKKVTEDIDDIKFNTAIAALMEWLNYLSSADKVLSRQELTTFISLLSPFAPHITEEIWARLKTEHQSTQESESWSIHQQPWPKYEDKYLIADEVVVVVQINGKIRASISVPQNSIQDQSKVEQMIVTHEKVVKYIQGQTIKKIIYVPGKIFSIVL